METVVDFISKVSEIVRSSLKETKKCIGKELVDATAGRKGYCVDRITDFFGTKISFLGVKYEKSELEKLEKIGQDILVFQGSQGRFFIPMNDVSAIGESLLLVKTDIKSPEIDLTTAKKDDVYKKFQLTKEAIKDILPDAIPAGEEGEKKWIKKLIGE